MTAAGAGGDNQPMRAVAVSVSLLLACGRGSSSPPATVARDASAPVVEDTGRAGRAVAHATDAGSGPVTLTAPTAVAAPPAVVGDPAEATVGPPLRASTLKATRRGAGPPTIALPDPRAQAALDAALAAMWRDHDRCRVELAMPTLVAVLCTTDCWREGDQSCYQPHTPYHLAIADGAVREVELEDLYLPGTELGKALPVSVGDEPSDFAALFGIATSVGVRRIEGTELADAYPWRAQAPWVRPDGPLAPMYVTAGIALAPVGSVARPLPPRRIAYSALRAALFAAWWRLAPAQRAAVRLFATAESVRELLLFPAGTPRSEVLALGDARAVIDVVPPTPLASLALAHTRVAAELGATIGDRAELVASVPRATVIVAARGGVDVTTSRLGRGWTYVGLASGALGWVAGRDIVDGDTCAPRPPAGAPTVLVGTGALAFADPAAPPTAIAWFAGPDPAAGAAPDTAVGATTIALHALVGCDVGAELRRLTVPGVLIDLWFTRTDGDTGAGLIAVVTAPELGAAARTVTVFAAAAAPVFTRAVARGDITGPATRDGKRRPGAYPVVVGATYLRWDGATLVDAAVGH